MSRVEPGAGQAGKRTGDRTGAIADFCTAPELQPGPKPAMQSLQKLGAP